MNFVLKPIHFDIFLKLASDETSNSGKFKARLRLFLDKQVSHSAVHSCLPFPHILYARQSISTGQSPLEEDVDHVHRTKEPIPIYPI
jgi:hypothetical protein